MAEFSFTVPGKPVPKGRPRFGGGRVFTPKKTSDYEKLVCRQCMEAKPEDWPTDTDYVLTIDVIYDSNVHGDLDNVVKSICDGMNKADVWSDDKRVSAIHVTRLFDPEPEVAVHIQSVPKVVFKKEKKPCARGRTRKSNSSSSSSSKE